MKKEPVIMLNTVTKVYLPYDEPACRRCSHLAPVFPDEVTDDILDRFSLRSVMEEYLAKTEPPEASIPKLRDSVPETTVPAAEEPTEAPEVAVVDLEEEPKPKPKPGLPKDLDLGAMSFDELKDYADANGIKYHPASKENGIRSAIVRHYV